MPNAGQFRKGQSGNPAGKRQGSRNRATKDLDQLLAGEADAITRKAIDLALAGDTVALRMCLDRIAPARKARHIRFDLPAIESPTDAVRANAALVAAVAAGELTPSEATEMSRLVDNVTRALETTDLAARIARLEESMKP